MASLHFAGYRGSIGSSYGDGKPSRRFGQQFATAPICSGTRVGSGREIGPRCRGSEIARQCGVAVRQERPLGKPGGLFLLSHLLDSADESNELSLADATRGTARNIGAPRRVGLACGAHSFFQQCQDFGGRGLGRAGIERRRRIVFEPELDCLRSLAVDQDRDQRQCEIDSRGDAAAGDAVAVDADARLCRDRAERPSMSIALQCVTAR